MVLRMQQQDLKNDVSHLLRGFPAFQSKWNLHKCQRKSQFCLRGVIQGKRGPTFFSLDVEHLSLPDLEFGLPSCEVRQTRPAFIGPDVCISIVCLDDDEIILLIISKWLAIFRWYYFFKALLWTNMSSSSLCLIIIKYTFQVCKYFHPLLVPFFSTYSFCCLSQGF